MASPRGFEGPYRPVRVDLPGPEARHEGVPIVIGSVSARVEWNDAGGLSIGCAIEQEELQLLRVRGIDAKVDAAVVDCGTERKTPAWLDGHDIGPWNAQRCNLTAATRAPVDT